MSLRLVVAVILALIGVVALVLALDYEMGSARRMGPGYFPVVLSAILILLSLGEIVASLLRPEARSIDWRPMIMILGAVTAFGVTLYLFGMIPAFFAVIGLAAQSERHFGWLPALVLAAVTSLGAYLLFSRFLGMTIPLVQFGP
ncbi:MAG: tripartite tricarboxylate transporter TctB family protein [Rhodobacterales bacterium]|nr:tripartite tricarboxylate transporter TctB family protein [Rhodobacterales bacterium]